VVIWVIRIVAAGTVWLFSAQGPYNVTKAEQIAYCEAVAYPERFDECDWMQQ
jgi:hypothetical protein